MQVSWAPGIGGRRVRPAGIISGMADPVILELAVNGATPRSRNRHVPRSPEEITAVAIDGVRRGAAIVHNHHDEPMFTQDGVHPVEPYLAAWAPVVEQFPDVLLYPTMAAGARGIPVARRWSHVEELASRGFMALVDPGSVNVGLTSDGTPTAAALQAYLEMLEPSGLPWSVAVLGGDVVGCGLAELAIARGGHVRVGLEDHAGPGEPRNRDLLDAAVALVERMGRVPATCAQTRAILGVPV